MRVCRSDATVDRKGNDMMAVIHDYDADLPDLVCSDCGLAFDLVGRCACPDNR